MDIFQLPGILWRRRLYVLVPMLLVMAMAGAYVVLVKPAIPVEANIFIDTQGLIAEKSELTPQLSVQAPDSAILESQLYVIQSSEILDMVVDRLELTKDPFLYKGPISDKELARAATVASLQKRLSVERAGQSLIVSIVVKHKDPVQGAKIANKIADIYLKKVHEARSDASLRASGAFEQQAQTLANRVRQAEEQLEKFKAANDLVSTGPQGLVIDQQVEGVNKQLIAARADLSAKLANYDQAQSLTVGSVQDGAIPEALASTALGNLRARYADLVSKLDELSTSLGTNHPQMRAARSQADSMKQGIEQELARIRASLKSSVERSQANVKSLEARLGALSRSSLDTSEAGIKARQLQSEVDTLRALYKAFLSRSEELGQRDSVNVNNSRVISRAVALGSGSSLVAQAMILIAAALFGFALGCGIAILRELAGALFVQMRSRDEAGADEDVETGTEVDSGAGPSIEEPAVEPALAVPKPATSPAAPAMPVRFANARSVVSPAPLNGLGVSTTVDRLLNMQAGDRPSTILLLSPGNDNPGRGLSRELADALYRHHKDVYFSSGEGADERQRLPGNDVPLGDVLRFRRLSPVAPLDADISAPTFRNFATRRKRPDFVIIDARGREARRHIEELLPQASGILLVANEDGQKALDTFLEELAPYRERMIGTILFDQAA